MIDHNLLSNSMDPVVLGNRLPLANQKANLQMA
jgi:hypothetical protein